MPRLAVPQSGATAANGAAGHVAPPPPPRPAALPAHLLAPPPKEGYQRRPIHLDAVYAKNAQGSVWEQPPPQQPADPAAAIRVQALDRLFAKQLAAAPAEGGDGEGGGGQGSPGRLPAGGAAAVEPCSSADSDAGSVCGSPGRLSRSSSLAIGRRAVIRFFTSGRKAVNLEILMRQLGSPDDVAQAVDELDTRRLKVEVLRELQANMPEETELQALHAYLDAGGDPRQLGKAEQLFVGLRRTKRLQQKLQIMEFKGALAERAGEVAAPLGAIASALDQLRSSPHLSLLLHTALRLGNALNAGRKAPQRGIRLGSLRKLADTRSMDGSTTLMHYLVALMVESAPGALLLGKRGSDCSAVPGAVHWTFSELEAQLSGLSSGIAMVRREAAAAGCGGESRQLSALAGQASAVQQRAQAMLAAARHKAAETLRFLGEEVPGEPAFSSSEPRRMLTDVRDFFALLHKAHADGERMAVCVATLAAQRAEEEAEAEEARRAAEEAAAAAAAEEAGAAVEAVAEEEAAAAAAGAEEAGAAVEAVAEEEAAAAAAVPEEGGPAAAAVVAKAPAAAVQETPSNGAAVDGGQQVVLAH